MNKADRILLVEDEESLLDVIKLNLEMEGYQVITAQNGKKALELYNVNRFNLIILDVMLPEINGFKVCQTIRLEDEKTPILFLTAKDGSEDRVQGLKTGADDYLTKPFNLEEFLLRVHNLLKRGAPSSEESLNNFSFKNNNIDFSSFEVVLANSNKIALSKKEAMLLKLLIERKNEVVSRKEILETVWGYDVYPSTRTVDNFILTFRKLFEENPKEPVHFHSVRGVGYKFTE